MYIRCVCVCLCFVLQCAEMVHPLPQPPPPAATTGWTTPPPPPPSVNRHFDCDEKRMKNNVKYRTYSSKKRHGKTYRYTYARIEWVKVFILKSFAAVSSYQKQLPSFLAYKTRRRVSPASISFFLVSYARVRVRVCVCVYVYRVSHMYK